MSKPNEYIDIVQAESIHDRYLEITESVKTNSTIHVIQREISDDINKSRIFILDQELKLLRRIDINCKNGEGGKPL